MRALAPLANGPLARLWVGQSLSAIGDQLQRMAVIWLSVELAGAGAGFVASAESAAVLVTALFAGAWTERWDARRTMIGADLVRAALAIVPVVAALMGRLDLAVLIVPAIVLMGLRGVFDPALQASLPRLAQGQLLLGANALMDATARIARLVGPALAGALAAVMPVVGLLAVNAVTFLASAAAIVSLRKELPAQRPEVSRSRWQALMLGVHAVRRQPLFVYLLTVSGIVSGLWMVALWLCVPLVVQREGLTAFGLSGLGVVGLVMGSYGAGNLASNLVIGGLEIRRPVPMVIWGLVVVGAGLALMGVAATVAPAHLVVPLMMAASAAAAVGGPMSDVPLASLRQTQFPLSEVAAVYRLWIVGDWGGMALATALAPAVLVFASPAVVMLACGVAIVVVSVPGFFRAAVRAPIMAE
jgi:DHA3 family macrolide efflux protein-like MFS transporter